MSNLFFWAQQKLGFEFLFFSLNKRNNKCSWNIVHLFFVNETSRKIRSDMLMYSRLKNKRAWWANFFGYFSRGPWVNRPGKRPEWHLVAVNLFFKRPGGKEYNGLCSVEDWLFHIPLFKIVIYVSYSRNIRLQTF